MKDPKRGDANSKVYKVEMKKLEKERQTAIDEKKSRLADMHQAQLERMEKKKSIQLYRHTKRTKQYFKVKFKTC